MKPCEKSPGWDPRGSGNRPFLWGNCRNKPMELRMETKKAGKSLILCGASPCFSSTVWDLCWYNFYPSPFFCENEKLRMSSEQIRQGERIRFNRWIAQLICFYPVEGFFDFNMFLYVSRISSHSRVASDHSERIFAPLVEAASKNLPQVTKEAFQATVLLELCTSIIMLTWL